MRTKRTVELRFSVAMPVLAGFVDNGTKPSMDLMDAPDEV